MHLIRIPATIFCLVWICLFQAAASENSRPNVLFIAVDDLNDWVGFMDGYPGEVYTPHMDRLAARGTAFLNAHTASPVCCPSRAAAMSGQLPSTSGIYHNRHWWKPNLPDLVTIPAHFKANGYHVAGAGKIFHHTIGNNPPQLWHDYQRLVFRDNPNAKQDKSQYPFTETTGDPPGFPFSGITLYSKEVDWGGLDKAENAFDDARSAQYCIDFLGKKQERPFFLACGIFRPHMPWYFPKKYLDYYPLDQVFMPEDLPEDLNDIPEAGRKLALKKYADMKITREAGKWQTAIQHYLASISFADAQVGKLLDALDASPFKENTVIVLWSDHGWHLGEKQHWHKRTLWEEGTRIPMIVVDPDNGNPGQRCHQPASTLDLFPTLIELCQLPPIQKQKLDGSSLVPWLQQPDQLRKQAAITVDENQHMSASDKRYRYIRYSDGSEEFYDHQSDPNEWTNQISNSEYKSAVYSLRSQLPEKLATAAKFNTAFDFNPFTYSWVDKKTGIVVSGR